MIKVEKNKVTAAGTPDVLILEIVTLLESIPDIFEQLKAFCNACDDKNRDEAIKKAAKEILDEIIRGRR